MGAALADRRRDRAAGFQLEARAPARHASRPRRLDRTVAAAADEFAGDCTATRPADLDGDKILRRLGLNRLKALDPPVPVVRYQRARPGELVHMEPKRLGRRFQPCALWRIMWSFA